MDMTYFAFIPNDLKMKQLKIAIVYLHEQNRFEAWLGGTNRKIQAEYIEMLNRKNISKYEISQIQPGVDSIIESTLVEQPDFNHPEELDIQIEKKLIKFVNVITSILDES